MSSAGAVDELILSRVKHVLDEIEARKEAEVQKTLEGVSAKRGKPWETTRDELDVLNGINVDLAREIEALSPSPYATGMEWTEMCGRYLQDMFPGVEVTCKAAKQQHCADSHVLIRSVRTGCEYRLMQDQKNNSLSMVNGTVAKVEREDERKIVKDLDTRQFHSGILVQKFRKAGSDSIEEVLHAGPHICACGPDHLYKALLVQCCRIGLGEVMERDHENVAKVLEFARWHLASKPEFEQLPVTTTYGSMIGECKNAVFRLKGLLAVPYGPLTLADRKVVMDSISGLDEKSFVLSNTSKKRFRK
jgi:hypothetical protein